MKCLFWFYRNVVKNLFPDLIGSCRFVPSCSAYTLEAVRRYGTIKGTYLGVKRILRCNGFFKGGFDPA